MKRKKSLMNEAPKRKWDHLTDASLHAALEVIQNGFAPDVVQSVDECLQERMRDGIPLNNDIVQSRLKIILDSRIKHGRSANQSLGLTAIRGTYSRPDTMIRDLQLAALVREKITKSSENCVSQNRSEYDILKGAIEDVSGELGIGERTVERAYRNYEISVSWFTKEFLFSDRWNDEDLDSA